MYGYEIIKELKGVFGDVWEPKTGSIYPALRRLETKGLIKTELKEDREFYILTEKGSEALKYSTDLMESEIDFIGRYHMMMPKHMRRGMMRRLRHRWRHGRKPIIIPPIHAEAYEEDIEELESTKELLKRQLRIIENKLRELKRDRE
jgi:DNA-binding PadR family transcriptional regulator